MGRGQLWGRRYVVWALQVTLVVASIIVLVLAQSLATRLAASLVIAAQVLLALSAYSTLR